VELGRGVVLVGAEEMWCLMSSGTVSGVTFSIKVKAGRRRMVVGVRAGEIEFEVRDGRGMLDADSMSF
jgi:hypothetical protein